MASITLRFFAAARAATGLDEVAVAGSGAGSGSGSGSGGQDPTLGELLASVRPGAGTDAGELAEILGRCSFLVDGVSTRDRSVVVPAGAVVDVMPPFAGG